MIKSLLPAGNLFPSGFSFVQNGKVEFKEAIAFLQKSATESLCIMGFRFQLRDIINRYLDKIIEYADFRTSNPNSDLNCLFCPPTKLNAEKTLSINLIIFSDGVNIKKSTLRKELWPVWVQVADLPPRLRMSCQNVVLAALFVGASAPNWNEIVPRLKSELASGVEIRHNSIFFRAFFKVKLLVSDLGAKSHILNMFKFNGFYGCHYCTAPGKTIGRTHSYYSIQQTGALREPSVNNVFVECAQLLPVDEVVNVAGVKGKSAFVALIDGLPLTAPVDYMHCVLLGVFPEVLKLCIKDLTADEKIKINVLLSSLSCPLELISYSRKIRSLDEVSQFKANEHFNWIFYLSQLVFRNRVQSSLYSHLLNLSFGIRLLLESSSESNLQAAKGFLSNFCDQIVSIHGGNERIETINVHCLRHLVDQVKRFGPLYCYSAMSFEAANRTLGEVFSGSSNECEVICRRILQKHKLAGVEMQNSDLKKLFGKISGYHFCEDDNFSGEFIETDTVKLGRRLYPEAIFFNRFSVPHTHVYFDSPAYRRSKLGNCFVSFPKRGEEVFAQIQYFLKIDGPPFFNDVHAAVKIYKTVEDIGSAKGFFFRVEETDVEDLVPVQLLRKAFHYKDLLSDEQAESQSFMVKLCSTFEHS